MAKPYNLTFCSSQTRSLRHSRSRCFTVVIALLLGVLTTVANAQNISDPLRSEGTPQPGYFESNHEKPLLKTIPAFNTPRDDHQSIVRTGYLQEVEPTPEPSSQTLVNKTNQLVESVPYDLNQLNQSNPQSPGTLNFGDLLKKIVLSTFLVLATCGMLLFFMKKSGFRGNFSSGEQASTEFREVDSMMVGPKCQMRLIKVRQHQVLVTTDPSGVKSVIHLAGAFSDHLESERNH